MSITWSALPDVRHEGCLKKIWLPYVPLVNLLYVAAWYRVKIRRRGKGMVALGEGFHGSGLALGLRLGL